MVGKGKLSKSYARRMDPLVLPLQGRLQAVRARNGYITIHLQAQNLFFPHQHQHLQHFHSSFQVPSITFSSSLL
jgi:hypothetical protein